MEVLNNVREKTISIILISDWNYLTVHLACNWQRLKYAGSPFKCKWN